MFSDPLYCASASPPQGGQGEANLHTKCKAGEVKCVY